MQEKGEKSSVNRPEMPPGGCLALPMGDKMAVPAGKEAGGGRVGACLGLARHGGPGQQWPPPARVLGTHCHLLPNVNRDWSRPHVQHHCLIKQCMVTSCSMGIARPHPTTSSGGSVWQNGREGDFITQKL